MFADQIMTAIETARGGRALDDVSRAVWRGLSEGLLDDDAAQRLAEAIHARRVPIAGLGAAQDGRGQVRAAYPARKPQRPPARSVAVERRRRLAASGPMPPALCARFTTGELAALRIVADEVRDRGSCTLPLDAIAARAGISRSTAQRALRQAARLGLVSIEERRRPGRPSLPNVVRVIAAEWRQWIARAPRRSAGEGVKAEAPRKSISLSGKEGGVGEGSHNRERHRPNGRGGGMR